MDEDKGIRMPSYCMSISVLLYSRHPLYVPEVLAHNNRASFQILRSRQNNKPVCPRKEDEKVELHPGDPSRVAIRHVVMSDRDDPVGGHL